MEVGVGGSGTVVEQSNNKIWLGTISGLYFSTDDGINWSKTPDFANNYIHQLYANQDTIVAVVSNSNESLEQIFSRTSLDNGNTWSERKLINEKKSLFFHPINLYRIKSNIYAHSKYRETYVSSDFGQNWSIFQTAGTMDRIIDVDDNGIIFYNFNDLEELKYYYYDGATHNVTQIVEPPQSDVLILHDNNIFITKVDLTNSKTQVLKSHVLANNYNIVADFDEIFYLSESSLIGNKFYFHSLSNAIVSENNGLTWNIVPEYPKILNHNEYVFDPLGNVIVPHLKKCVLKYSPDLTNNISTNFNFHNKPVVDVYNLSNIKFALTEDGLVKYDIGNNQWTSILPSSKDIAAGVASGDTVIFFNNDFFKPCLQISLDRSISWVTSLLPFDIGPIRKSSMVLFNGELHIMTDDFIYTSKDLGITWKTLPTLNNISESGCIENANKVGMISSINSDLWSVTESGYTFKFLKSSNTWEYKTCQWSPGVNSENRILNLDGFYVLIISEKLSISSNGTNFKTPKNIGKPAASIGSIVSDNNIWYASFNEFGIYYTADQGDHWFPLDLHPFININGGLICHDHNLIAGSAYSGLWKRSLTAKVIKGKVFRDFNNNGLFDIEDVALPNIKIKTSLGGHFASTNSSGEYAIPVNLDSDTLKLLFSTELAQLNPSYYIISNNNDTLDFALNFKENILDGSFTITNINQFRPGFNTLISANVQNSGSAEIPFELKILLDPKLDFISATPTGYIINNDTILWTTPTLQYAETFETTIEVKTPVNVPLGDQIRCIGFLTPELNDIQINDNIDSLVVVVVGSYDPNDKSCNAGEIFHPDLAASGADLEYTIRFQNTGTFYAENVHIKDVLDQKLDPATFKILSHSHEMYWRISDKGQLDFYFDGINLPDSNQNEVLSHGFVKFAIKAKSDFKLKDQIKNTAFIYFDFNEAIVTNTVITTIDYPASTHPRPHNRKTIIVYPNPTSSAISMKLEGIIDDQAQVKIIDVNGKVIKSEKIKIPNNLIELDGLLPGMYFGLVTNNKGNSLGNFKFVFK